MIFVFVESLLLLALDQYNLHVCNILIFIYFDENISQNKTAKNIQVNVLDSRYTKISWEF